MSALPEADFDVAECNSTAHYNGLLSTTDICSGARRAQDRCRVRIKMAGLLNDQQINEFFQNDLGAPMLCAEPSTGSWTLRGVLSREGACRPAAHPDVFSSVADDRQWIARTTGIAA